MARHLRQQHGDDLRDAFVIMNRYRDGESRAQQAQIARIDERLRDVMRLTLKVSKVPSSFSHHL